MPTTRSRSITPEDVRKHIGSTGIAMVDLKFTNLLGRWHHVTVPTKRFLESDVFTEGVAFDGSSTPGFSNIERGDLAIVPDPNTLLDDPFWERPTASMICSVVEADSRKPFRRDPRGIAGRAEEYLKSTGVADRSVWGPEFEFYVFDRYTVRNEINVATYEVDSVEADWRSDERGRMHTIPPHGGYHAIPPLDGLHDLRTAMCEAIELCGAVVHYHHHEVGGPGQSEIELARDELVRVADVTQWTKYAIRMTAARAGRSATFLPKPLFGEAGSGMHFHQHLFRGDRPLFYDADGYGGLSKLALSYVAGILSHAPALCAFTNPSTNSYKRLVPGYEAPVNAFFSTGNRSAAVRIPLSATSPDEKRVEFRPPDGTCNPYLAMAAQLMAGIDGIVRGLDPTELGFGPFDENLLAMSEEKRSKITRLPSSLGNALHALEKDNGFLLAGGVFAEDAVERWIEMKWKDVMAVRERPHPYEFFLYYDS